MDFALTVYTVFNSKTLPVLPKLGWHLQKSKASQEFDCQKLIPGWHF